MARKTVHVDITEEGRDQGKLFLITELPATQGEKWAARALNALLASGIQIPDSVAARGMQGLAAAGLSILLSNFSGIPWDLLEPLLDEMMSCVKCVPDPSNLNVTRPLMEQDIEEIKTRLTLRKAWVELHTGFSFAAKPSTSDSAAEAGPSTT